MKILYGHQIFTRQVYGGVSRYIHEISRRIPQLQGDSTEVFAPLHVNAYLASNPALLRPARKLDKFRGGAAVLGTIDIAIGMIQIRSRTDIDIFHPSYYAQFDYGPRKSRRVVTVYDMTHELEPASFSRHDPTAKLKYKAVAIADHVICISENTRRDLLDITGISAAKTSVIHLGHSLTTNTMTAKAVQTQREPILLYVGNRSGYKNFNLLLDAFASATDLRHSHEIVCFGGGPFAPMELARIGTLGLNGRVRHEKGGDAALSRLYASASMLVYPSKREGFGIPPLEAMAHGCPVVCARASSLPEVAGDAADYFDPADPADLVQAIERVLRSHAHAESLIERGRARVSAFSWDRCAAETHALYRRINGDS